MRFMEDFDIFLIAIAIIVTIGLICSTSGEIRTAEASPNNISCPLQTYNISCPDVTYNISCPDVTYPDLPLLVLDVMAIKKAHGYRFGDELESSYVCKHYARDLYNLLKSQGFGPKICNTEMHAWVQIGDMVIDLTRSEPFVNPQDWKGYPQTSCTYGDPPEWWFK